MVLTNEDDALNIIKFDKNLLNRSNVYMTEDITPSQRLSKYLKSRSQKLEWKRWHFSQIKQVLSKDLGEEFDNIIKSLHSLSQSLLSLVYTQYLAYIRDRTFSLLSKHAGSLYEVCEIIPLQTSSSRPPIEFDKMYSSEEGRSSVFLLLLTEEKVECASDFDSPDFSRFPATTLHAVGSAITGFSSCQDEVRQGWLLLHYSSQAWCLSLAP